MLPLLPALILLLLQGPANIERMAHDGHLQAALTAIQRHMPERKVNRADEAVLASLLAVSTDRQLSRALVQLLAFAETDPPVERVVIPAETSAPIPIPPSLGRLREGFAASQRSRDGPF